MTPQTLYAQIELAKTRDELALAVEYARHLSEPDRESLSELVRQRQAEFAGAAA